MARASRKKAEAVAPAASSALRPSTSERGEVVLSLDGQEFCLRPSYEAIVEFEAITGLGLLQLARSAIDGAMPVSILAQVAAECIKAWGRATKSTSAVGVNAGRVAELILESSEGYRGALVAVASMLSLASTGGYTASGELKPATTTTA